MNLYSNPTAAGLVIQTEVATISTLFRSGYFQLLLAVCNNVHCCWHCVEFELVGLDYKLILGSEDEQYSHWNYTGAEG
jgi:hypothetical protein